MHRPFIFTSLLALALQGNSSMLTWAVLAEEDPYWSLYVWCCVFYVTGLGRADWITSQDTEVSAAEGRSVSLRCSYNASSTSYVVLYWFQQYPNKALEYILHRGWENHEKGVADFAVQRFYSKSTAHSIDLQIRNLIPADTALYFCALASTKIASHWAATHKQAEGMMHRIM